MVIKINYTSSDIYVSTNVSPIYVVVNYSGTSGGGGVWGLITGTLSTQTDLQDALDDKFDDPTGTTAQYLRGDGSLATFPTIPSITGLVPYSGASGNVDLGANSITANSLIKSGGTSSQFLKADGSVDSSVYLTGITSGNVTTALGFTPVNPTRSIATTSPIVGGGDLSADRTISIPAATGSVSGHLTSTDWTTFNNKQNALGFTAVPTTRTITINGTTLDLSADRTYTVSASATPAGSNTQIQYNNSGVFGADAGFTYNIGGITLTNTTGGSATPIISLTTSSFSSQIVAGNNTYPFAGGANSLNLYHGVSGPIVFYNGGSTPLRRFSLLSDGKLVIGSASTASTIFEVNASYNGDGINLKTSQINSGYYISHSATGSNNWNIVSSGTGSSQTAGTLSIGATNNNLLLFPTGNVVLGLSNSSDAGFKLDVNGTARVIGDLTVQSQLLIGTSIFASRFAANGQLMVEQNYLDGATDNTGATGAFLIGSAGNISNLSVSGKFYQNLYLKSTITTSFNAAEINEAVIGTVINGTSTGVMRGLYINPTITSGGTGWVAIQSSLGGAYFNTTSVQSSAILQADSTTKGFIPPRMTNAQRAAISSPAVGLIVYCTDATEGMYQYINNAWVNLTGIVTNRQTASYTLALGDSNDLVEMNVATANNLTVPLNSSVAFPIGTKIDIAQYGAGQTTIVATSGVTVRSAGGALKLAVQYSGASLVKIGTDEWYLFGDITV